MQDRRRFHDAPAVPHGHIREPAQPELHAGLRYVCPMHVERASIVYGTHLICVWSAPQLRMERGPLVSAV